MLHPGRIEIDGVEIKNPVKSPRIPPVILKDLESLAIQAFPEESEYSQDQSYAVKSIKELKARYPNEQPEEVWRRDIATLVSLGINAESIAVSLFNRNKRLIASLNIGSLPREGRQKAIEIVKDKILELWPSA